MSACVLAAAIFLCEYRVARGQSSFQCYSKPRTVPKMKGLLQEIEDPNASIITAVIVLLISIIVIWTLRRQSARNKEDTAPNSAHNVATTSQCSSRNCVRCHGEKAIKNQLLQRYKEYVLEEARMSEISEEQLSKMYPRVWSLVQSIDCKYDILRTVYKESGYKVELADSEPHVWTMPGLKHVPFWSVLDHKGLETIASLFEADQTLRTIQSDFDRIALQQCGWKTNSVPSGRWKVFHLFNQGVKIEENCAKCPQTTQYIESLSAFMNSNAFGNAMFSVLEPNSRIEPHTGPCNFRLRCHLPLLAPKGYKMKVGTQTCSWQAGKLLVFDDSYVHTVWHESEGDCMPAKERVLLIFDVWHPQVDTNEQNVLNYIV